jgi:hypothetical protein
VKEQTKAITVWEARQRRDKLEATAENVLRKYGRVSDRLALELLYAEIDYAVANDDIHDRYMEDE